MTSKTAAIQELRERTGAAMIECSRALKEADGDINKALLILKDQGAKIASKKEGREVKEGRIETYIHTGNRGGAMVELNCETDFVGRNEAFIQLAKDIALHVYAAKPRYLRREDVPAEALEAPDVQSPEQYYEDYVLLDQPFVRDPSRTISQMITETIGKTRENIVVGRYVRYEIGA
jgi:elongation factor Ts